MKKDKIIASVLTVLTVLLLSDFRLFDTYYLIPNILWGIPLLGFYYTSVLYFFKAFNSSYKVVYKIGIILLGGLGVFSLLYLGFCIWKLNNGNVFTENVESFQINLKNIYFWVLYQSYLLLFFFSSFKQLVTIDQK